MKLVVATSNSHKVREIREILNTLGIEVVSAAEAGGMPDVVEDGATFEENRRQEGPGWRTRLPLPRDGRRLGAGGLRA